MSNELYGNIYLIPTELAIGTGNRVLGISVVETILALDTFAVENIRTARRFISSLALGIEIEKLSFFELSKDSTSARHEELIDLLKSGKSIGIMSEAGCPGIADPGAVLVKIAHREGIRAIPLVGPSSFVLALMASGLNGQRFAFHGYLPIEKGSRLAAIKELERKSSKDHEAQIFMETPFRNEALLADIVSTCHKSTLLCIAADINAPNEMIKTWPIEKWQRSKPVLHKIPTVFILQAN